MFSSKPVIPPWAPSPIQMFVLADILTGDAVTFAEARPSGFRAQIAIARLNADYLRGQARRDLRTLGVL